MFLPLLVGARGISDTFPLMFTLISTNRTCVRLRSPLYVSPKPRNCPAKPIAQQRDTLIAASNRRLSRRPLVLGNDPARFRTKREVEHEPLCSPLVLSQRRIFYGSTDAAGAHATARVGTRAQRTAGAAASPPAPPTFRTFPIKQREREREKRREKI